MCPFDLGKSVKSKRITAGEPSLKFQLPSQRFGSLGVLKIFPKRMTDRVNYSATKVFVEQPRLYRVC